MVHTYITRHGDVHPISLVQEVYPIIADKIIIVRHPWKIKWLEYMFRSCGSIHCRVIKSHLYTEQWNDSSSDEDTDENKKNTDRQKESYEICDYHNRLYGWDNHRCAKAIALEMQDKHFIKT